MTLTFSEAQLQLVLIEAEAEAEVLTCTCTGGWKTASNFFSFFEQFLFQFRKMQMLLKISLSYATQKQFLLKTVCDKD